MANQAARVMFEIYRDARDGCSFRAVYFTELDEHNKEAEISRAMAGEHLYDGFLNERKLNDGKRAVAAVIDRLNNGETLDESAVAEMLADYEA